MKKQDIKTKIEFGGFYQSIHLDLIDHKIDSYYENGNFPLYDNDNIDYKKTYDSYIESYAKEFESYIFNEYKLNIDFKNISLNSPEFYNFETDTIYCDVDKEQAQKLINHFNKNFEFLEHLKNRTKSYDGYISFYTYDQAINNKDDILIMYLLEYLANKFNEKFIIYGDIEFDIYLTLKHFKLNIKV
tara:strand:+ start:666 stop:1226 length:561 start_codon:yes stop_codon:yes gene_type:complete